LKKKKMLIKYLKFLKKVEQDRYMVWMKKKENLRQEIKPRGGGGGGGGFFFFFGVGGGVFSPPALAVTKNR